MNQAQADAAAMARLMATNQFTAGENALERQFTAGESQKTREFTAAENAATRAQEERLTKLQMAREAINAERLFRQNQSKAALDLAPDPMRFTNWLQGGNVGASTGPSATPYDQFKMGITRRNQSPMPTVDPNASIPELNSALQKLAQLQAPDQNISPFLGMAEGGTLNPMNLQPRGLATLVGEGVNGEGLANGTAEIAISRPDGSVEIVPLAKRGATGTDLPNLGGFPSLFQSLRNRLGITEPMVPNPSSQTKSLLGVLDTPGTGAGYNPTGWQAGGTPLDIFGGYSQALAQQGISDKRAWAMTDPINRAIGFLPAPHRIPLQWWNALAPTEQSAVMSAYRMAGISEKDLLDIMGRTQLAGSAPSGMTGLG